MAALGAGCLGAGSLAAMAGGGLAMLAPTAGRGVGTLAAGWAVGLGMGMLGVWLLGWM